MIINTFTLEIHHNGVKVTSYPDWQEDSNTDFYIGYNAPEALEAHIQKHYSEEENQYND